MIELHRTRRRLRALGSAAAGPNHSLTNTVEGATTLAHSQGLVKSEQCVLYDDDRLCDVVQPRLHHVLLAVLGPERTTAAARLRQRVATSASKKPVAPAAAAPKSKHL